MNTHKASNAPGTWSSNTQSWPTLWKQHQSGELETGIPEIDRDHMNLISLIGHLNATIIWRQGIEKVSDAMQALVDDANRRFAREITLLGLSGYPDAGEHATCHDETMARLREIIYGLDRNTPEHLWIEAGLNVKRLLIDHLLTEDLKYREYFKGLDSTRKKTLRTQ